MKPLLDAAKARDTMIAIRYCVQYLVITIKEIDNEKHEV